MERCAAPVGGVARGAQFARLRLGAARGGAAGYRRAPRRRLLSAGRQPAARPMLGHAELGTAWRLSSLPLLADAVRHRPAAGAQGKDATGAGARRDPRRHKARPDPKDPARGGSWP